MRRLLGAVVSALVLLAVSGCVWPRGESQPVHTYQFSLDPGGGSNKGENASSLVLLVSPPQAAPGFPSAQMAYLTRSYELEFYATNFWADSPARLVAPLLVQALSESGAWRAVVPMDGTARGEYRLDIDEVMVQQEFLQRPSQARMRWRAQVVDVKDHRILGARVFEAIELAPTDDAYGGVQAANQAVRQLLMQLSGWLQQCVQQRIGCSR